MKSIKIIAIISMILLGVGLYVNAEVTVWSNPRSIPADGASYSMIRANVYDNSGSSSPVASIPVTFYVIGPGVLRGENPKIADANGVATIELLSTTNPGNVTVTAVTDSYDYYYCRVHLTELLNQPPVVSASANPIVVVKRVPVQFYAIASDLDGNIISYQWNFGDGNTSEQQNPVHSYKFAGTYKANASVADNDGATATNTGIITVKNNKKK
jgi:PKD repeat protein